MSDPIQEIGQIILSNFKTKESDKVAIYQIFRKGSQDTIIMSSGKYQWYTSDSALLALKSHVSKATRKYNKDIQKTVWGYIQNRVEIRRVV